MRISLLFFLLLQCFVSNAQQEGFVKKFSGTIGKAAVIADIKVIDTIFSGSYYYAKDWKTIQFTGAIKSHDITATEEVNDSVSGYITGKMSNDNTMITGTWQNSTKKKSLPIAWKVSDLQGSAVLEVVNKQYNYVWKKNKNGDELGCKANYSLCYITKLESLEVEKLIDGDLLEYDIEPDATDDDLKEAATDFMNDDFDSYQEDFDTAYVSATTEENMKWMNTSPQIYQWKKSQTCDVLFNENYLLSLETVTDDMAGGGSHRSFEYVDMVYDLKTGNQLQLDDLFKPGYRNELSQLAQMRLLSTYKAGSMQQLIEKGFLQRGNLVVTDNFYVKKNGIGFTYNPNEIASASMGAITVIVPWSSLQHLINPTGPLAWALKK